MRHLLELKCVMELCCVLHEFNAIRARYAIFEPDPLWVADNEEAWPYENQSDCSYGFLGHTENV